MGSKVVYRNFRSSFYTTIELPRLESKKYLEKLIEAELEEREDIPKPFYLSFKIISQKEESVKVSVCVVKKEEIDAVVQENPNVKAIYTDEAAFMSYLSEKDTGPSYGVIVYEKEISLFLFEKEAILYSTRLPKSSENLTAKDIEAINSVIRHTVSLSSETPKKIHIFAKTKEIPGTLMLPYELTDTFKVVENRIKSYNLMPSSFLKKRFLEKYITILSTVMISISTVLLILSAANIKRSEPIKSKTREKEVEFALQTFKDYLELKRMFSKTLGNVENYVTIKSSFGPVLRMAEAIEIITKNGADITKAVALREAITVNGIVSGATYSESYLLFLNILSHLKGKFDLISESFNPENGRFQIVFK